MIAEIISIGDELLVGQVVNTNATWIAQHLHEIGVPVKQLSAIADDAGEIIKALGLVFGDIGTSPIYTVTVVFLLLTSTPDNIMGVISLIFWTWIWGVPGALLSVPILVSIKVVCDHIPALSSASELLTS